MAATNETTNYKLPLFVGTDKPSWLGDWNAAMTAIDTAIGTAAGDATNAATIATSAKTAAEAAQASVTSMEETITSMNEDIQDLQGTVSQQQQDIQSLQNQPQSPVSSIVIQNSMIGGSATPTLGSSWVNNNILINTNAEQAHRFIDFTIAGSSMTSGKYLRDSPNSSLFQLYQVGVIKGNPLNIAVSAYGISCINIGVLFFKDKPAWYTVYLAYDQTHNQTLILVMAQNLGTNTNQRVGLGGSAMFIPGSGDSFTLPLNNPYQNEPLWMP